MRISSRPIKFFGAKPVIIFFESDRFTLRLLTLMTRELEISKEKQTHKRITMTAFQAAWRKHKAIYMENTKVYCGRKQSRK